MTSCSPLGLCLHLLTAGSITGESGTSQFSSCALFRGSFGRPSTRTWEWAGSRAEGHGRATTPRSRRWPEPFLWLIAIPGTSRDSPSREAYREAVMHTAGAFRSRSQNCATMETSFCRFQEGEALLQTAKDRHDDSREAGDQHFFNVRTVWLAPKPLFLPMRATRTDKLYCIEANGAQQRGAGSTNRPCGFFP